MLPGDTVRVILSKGPEPVEEPEPDEEEPPEEDADVGTEERRVRITPEIPSDLAGTAFDIRIVVTDVQSNGEERVVVDEQITETKEFIIHLLVSEEQDGIVQTFVNGELNEDLSEGGRLVYSTCTIDKEENEAIVEQFLR